MNSVHTGTGPTILRLVSEVMSRVSGSYWVIIPYDTRGHPRTPSSFIPEDLLVGEEVPRAESRAYPTRRLP